MIDENLTCDNEDCGHTIIEHAKGGECTVCACEKFLMIQPEVEL
jgi:hypothetical protein